MDLRNIERDAMHLLIDHQIIFAVQMSFRTVFIQKIATLCYEK